MRFGLTLALVTLAAAPVAAQAPPLPAAHPPFTLERTEQLPLDVPVNNEHYLLSIALPPSYEKEKARRYPVVYLLDGYWDFPALYHMQGDAEAALRLPRGRGRRRTPAASPRPSTGACGSPSGRTWTGRAQGNRSDALRSAFRP